MIDDRQPFRHWDDVTEWTGRGDDTGWRGRRLTFGGCWVLHMRIDAGYRWAHSHPQSQVVWIVSGQLRARTGDPDQPESVQERVLGPGEIVQIPSGVHHDMTALSAVEAWEVRGMEGPDEWERFCVPTGR